MNTLWKEAASAVAVGVLVFALWKAHEWRTQSAYANGVRDTLAEVASREPVARERVVVAAARVDTVRRDVERRVVQVESLLVVVAADTTPRAPSVDSTLSACAALALSCTEFRRVVALERAARAGLDSTMGARIIATSDSVRVLAKRPTWKRTVLLAASAGAVGYVAAGGLKR